MFRHEIIVTKGILPFKIIIHNSSALQITKHWHRALEIDFTIHGEGDYLTSGHKTHLSDGDFIIINSGEVHGVENIGPGNARRSITILVPFEFLNELLPEISHLYFVSQINDQEIMLKVKTELTRIYQLWTNQHDHENKIEILGHFYLLMALLLKNFVVPKKNIICFNDARKQDKVKDIINFLTANYRNSLTLDEVADHFGLSKAYLDRLFKTEVQTSLIHYLQLIRLQHAYDLLVNTDLPVTVIADQCGFANVRSLQKIFKDVYSATPSTYRKKLKSQ
ncbi:MAG: AraC family transcriptional regulator [Lactobacillus panisapium]|nr:AraC family transcriptional regulator [Lactobacillus panisapium]MCT6854174.1 AraC family transcriptional regulator [Lactobacillus panisapium]MCT6865808.1 AraC family transcriptional regulator [Lactobacillus panisapium]